MKNWVKWIVGLSILSLLIVLFYYIVKDNNEPFNTIEFETNSYINNQSQISYIDTLLYVGLNEMELDSLSVLVRELDRSQRNLISGVDLNAFIIKGDIPKQYLLYIKSGKGRKPTIKIISHEIQHIIQYETKQLVVGTDYVIWERDTLYNIDNIPYTNRPWETDAFQQEDLIYNKIYNILYN